VEQFQSHSDWHIFDELKEGIILRALENLGAPGVTEALARAYLSQIKRHQVEFMIDLREDEKRHHLVMAMLPLLPEFGLSYIWLISGRPPLVRGQDIFWLIDRLGQSTSAEDQQGLAALIDRTMDLRELVQVDAVVRANKALFLRRPSPGFSSRLNWIQRKLSE
jgi:hypothetical protein